MVDGSYIGGVEHIYELVAINGDSCNYH